MATNSVKLRNIVMCLGKMDCDLGIIDLDLRADETGDRLLLFSPLEHDGALPFRIRQSRVDK